MLYAARLGIVFDPPRVREAAHTSVDGGDLRAILPTIASYLDGNRNHAEAQDHSSEPLYGE